MLFDNLFDDFNPFGTYTYRQPRPQTSTMFRNDNRSIMVRKLVNDEYNYMCFDCHREISELNFFDLKNGIFLCNHCAQKHARLSKEITQPMTGSIKLLEEKDLLILYYGGNRKLYDFIKKHYPLLENMEINEKYATKAMDYYRHLLRAQAYDEPQPNMPGKKKAYTSIFAKEESPVKEVREQKHQNKNKNIRERRMKDTDENNNDNDDDLGNFLRSTFFGDDLFNRNKRKVQEEEEEGREKEREEEEEKDEEEKDEEEKDEEEKEEKEEENDLKKEPADINKKETDEIDDAGMKIEKRKNSLKEKEEEKIPKTERVINHREEPKKIEKEEKKEEKKENENTVKVNTVNTLTINQIGELSRYPDALEIDGMECVCE